MFVQGAISNKIMQELQLAGSASEGAILSFQGRVRADKFDEKEVCCIEFTAQQKIAEQVSAALVEQCIEKFQLSNAVVKHSLGKIEVGETCFFVMVKAAHRKEAYQALPWLVDSIKAKCPIFGKEIFTGGTHQWKINK